MASTTNYSWTTPDDTDLVKDGAAAIRTLGSAIDTTVFNNAGAAVQKSLIDAAGDLIYGTANDTVARLAIGTAAQILKVNAGGTAPEWGAAPAPSSNWTLVSTATGTSGSSINISVSGYDRIRIHFFMDYTGLTRLRFNNLSSTLYKQYIMKYNTYSSQTVTGVDLSPFSGTDPVGGFVDIDNCNSSGRPKYFIQSQDGQAATITFDGFYDDNINITSVDFVSAGSFTDYAVRVWGL